MNDIERAIESINNQKQFIGIDYSKGKDLTAICLSGNLAESTVMALEKQIPKKVLSPLTFGSVGTCMVCSAAQVVQRKYCYNCGQKLD